MPQTAAVPCYTVGIDLALRADHLAGLLDERGRPVGKQIRFGRTYDEMRRMFETVNAQVPEGGELVWGCEATGAAWRPVTAFLLGEGQAVSLENPAAIAAQRDVDHRFFKDDKVDARTIAELLFLRLLRGIAMRDVPSPECQAMRSLARRIEGMCNELSSAKTRFTAFLCDAIVPSLSPAAHEWASPTMLPVLSKFADIRDIARVSLPVFIKRAKKVGGPRVSEAALTKLHDAAEQALRCYGDQFLFETYAILLRDAISDISQLQERIKSLREHLQALLDQMRTEDDVAHGLSVPGVGKSTLDTLMALYGPPAQWAPIKTMKRFAGLVPVVNRSGNSDAAPRMSKLGEPMVRKVIYQIGSVARRYDAYFAAHYYDQMVHKAKGHIAASISTGIKVLNCLRAVLRDGRDYQPRDPRTGCAITKDESYQLAQTEYAVPHEIRAARAKQSQNAHTNPKQTRQSDKTPSPHTAANQHAHQAQPATKPTRNKAAVPTRTKETAQPDQAQVKDMPKHSRRRAANLN